MLRGKGLRLRRLHRAGHALDEHGRQRRQEVAYGRAPAGAVDRVGAVPEGAGAACSGCGGSEDAAVAVVQAFPSTLATAFAT